MKNRTVLDHPEIVDINPIRSAVIIQQDQQPFQQFFIGLIHDTGNRRPQDLVARINNDGAKYNCHNGVDPFQVRKIDEGQTSDDAKC